MAVLVGVVVAGVVGVGLAGMDLVEAVLEEGFGLRPLVFLVLKGLAMGARLIVVEDVSIAGDARPAETVRKRMDWTRRRSSIYCTPRG
jgi:hypothetical protein